MDKYLTQLIEMLREAQDQKPDLRKHADFHEEMEAIESIFQNDHPSMAYHFGIPKEFFPPVEKLTDKHFDMLVPELLNLWRKYNYSPCFVQNLPNKWKYKLMRDELNENHPLISGNNGTWYIEFCHYDPNECPLPSEFCDCKDIL
ncbi:MAG: hypothetical protein IPK35_01655 [Saprospiraceae bacterium]|jgi:histidinol phosphatase-like PHP family hydrolase|nr:hypothetical protein [Saprospiraceae bacterium]